MLLWLIGSVILGLVVVALPDVEEDHDLKSVVAVLALLVLFLVAVFAFKL